MINIVMGMHRSGTSAIAGLLHTNGIVMGEDPFFQPRPSQENPAGYFEDVRFRQINDRVLMQHGHVVSSWDMPADAPYWMADTETYADATTLVQSMNDKYPMWGWKDPRNSLTWPFWSSVLDNLGLLGTSKLIATIRDHDQIARSMIARGNEGTEEYFRALSKEYLSCIRQARPDEFIPFDASPGLISHVLNGIGIPITDLSFLDPELRGRTK